MFCKVYTASCMGIDGHMVQVEADMSNGLPTFHIVGEISGEVRESGTRIMTAIRNSGFSMPPKRYVVNLAPANFRKTGTGFDFPVAVALLCCVEQMNPDVLNKSIFIGELGLNGKVVPVNGVLVMVSKAREAGYKNCFLAQENVADVCMLPDMNIYGVRNLREAILHLQGKKLLARAEVSKREENVRHIPEILNFRDIRGQEMVKRCIQISAAGRHNLLLVGPPGSGKTMMAERMPYILPQMDLNEQMTATKIYGIAGRIKPGNGLIKERPFRRPHHTVSDKVLIGGGSIPMPGEMSLAHGGILFLDEFAEFSRSAIEALRQPMESGEVFIHRLRGHYCFPAKPLIVAAVNPCPCGYYPDRERCMCTEAQIRHYMGKISGPVMERMDLCVRVNRVDYENLKKYKEGMDSEHMLEGVEKAFRYQKERFKERIADGTVLYNSDMDSAMTMEICRLDDEGQAFLEKAYDRYHLSARVYQKVLKVSRTIADLEDSRFILKKHIAEALCYRLPQDYMGGTAWE